MGEFNRRTVSCAVQSGGALYDARGGVLLIHFPKLIPYKFFAWVILRAGSSNPPLPTAGDGDPVRCLATELF